MPVGRRAFLATIGASLAAPAILRARARDKRYRIAFSTLGCPAWSWRTILDNADRLGYAAIELRGVAGEMDLPKVPELSGSRLAETRKDLAALGLVISDLGASARMHEKDTAAREKQLDEGRRFIDLAHALGVKYVRMFGDKVPEGEARDEVLKRVIEGFQQMAAHAKPAGVVVLIESHGDFTNSKDLEAILRGVSSDAFALLWDAHHTFVAGKEQPGETYARLRGWIRHTHLKDSKPEGSERRYVLTGTGEVPVREQVKVLAGAGYPGYYCFEWEKKWHPEIEEPEVAFPHYAKTMGEYLAAAGVKPA
jgi:sugar phosphate isomerase/epimerase